MTTAHRPTWKAAVGAGEGGNWSSGGAQSHMRSAKDAAAFTKIKYRERGVRKEGEVLVEESLRRLEEAERKEKELKKIGKRQVRESDDVESSVKLLKVQGEGVDVSVLDKFDDADSGDEGGEEEEESDLDDSDDSDEDEGSDDDEDEEELLRLEMEKVRERTQNIRHPRQTQEKKHTHAHERYFVRINPPLWLNKILTLLPFPSPFSPPSR